MVQYLCELARIIQRSCNHNCYLNNKNGDGVTENYLVKQDNKTKTSQIGNAVFWSHKFASAKVDPNKTMSAYRTSFVGRDY